MYTLVKTPKAENDLIAIWQYTYKKWGRNKAKTYLLELDASLKSLLKNPHLYEDREEFNPPVRFLKFKRHICIYFVVGLEVQVIRVLHERMDVVNHIGQ